MQSPLQTQIVEAEEQLRTAMLSSDVDALDGFLVQTSFLPIISDNCWARTMISPPTAQVFLSLRGWNRLSDRCGFWVRQLSYVSECRFWESIGTLQRTEISDSRECGRVHNDWDGRLLPPIPF